MWRLSVILVVSALFMCDGQGVKGKTKNNLQTITPTNTAANLHNGFDLILSQRIGKFSLELLYFTSQSVQPQENLIIAPLTIWTILAVIAEGASGRTLTQISSAVRFYKNRSVTKREFLNVAKWLRTNTTTVELHKVNTMYIDPKYHLEKDFQSEAAAYYDTQVEEVNFKDKDNVAMKINNDIAQFTHGRITKVVDSSYFDDAKMILTSTVYFRGQWTAPFNASYTLKAPFYDNNGQKIGEVNMMYNRFNYPFANINEIQGRVIEIPYGIEGRLSMLIMLPKQNVSLDSMFRNFQSVPLDKMFQEMKISQQEYSDDEVDCYIPRFKIESDIVLNPVLKKMGIHDLFDPDLASLPTMTRSPVYVSKIVHKAEIEVTEEGTTASAVSTAEFANRIGVVRFEANRPFAYMIVEKVTNSFVFGGFYRQPSLY